MFYIKYRSEFEESLERLQQTIADSKFPRNDNLEVLSFFCIYGNKLNLYFMSGDFEQAQHLEQDILDGIKRYEDKIDEHHVMVLYYKLACMYFGMGDNKMCIQYLKKIINNKQLTMREDLMCFARVLSLVAHYEAGMDYHLEVQLKSTYKFLLKMNDLHEVQKEMIKFLRNLGEIYPHELKDEFKKLHTRLKKFEDHPYEKRAFLYLDIISWLESKIENRSVADIIKEKAKKLNR